MEKYIAVEEMVELFNSFTHDKDLTIGGGILWLGADTPANVVVRGEMNQYDWPTPAVVYYRTEEIPLGDNSSYGYRQEDILSVELYEYSTGSWLRWSREPHEVIGRLEYLPGENTEGFHERFLRNFMEAEGIKPLI